MYFVKMTIYLGDFAEKLPDFQMMEILQHIIMSMPMRNEDQKIQLLLLQTIHKVNIHIVEFDSIIIFFQITQIKRSKHTNHSHSSRVNVVFYVIFLSINETNYR